MKKSFIWLVMLTMIFTMFVTPTYANDPTFTQADNDESFIEGELIVSVEGESSSSVGIQSTYSVMSQSDELENKGFKVVDSLLEQSDSDSIRAFGDDEFKTEIVENMGLVYLTEYSTEDYDSIEEAEASLEETLKELGVEVRYIEKNYEMYALEDVSTEDVEINMHPNQEWHYEMINAPQAWDITTGSSDVIQAVLDTGIDHNHQSLSNLVDTDLGRSFVGGSTMDVQGHGTHVAGTIASYGNVSGVMHNATLVPVKVLGDDGRGSMYGITQGILYSADIGADVINMSLGGGGYNQSMDEATQTAVNAGSIVIAASGNEYRNSISYPAAYDSVIAVGSVTSNGTRSSFSNYGDGLELMAPGSNIYSTVPNNGYDSFSGTSMASPHAAGVAGLMRAVDSSVSVSEARSILQDTAQEAGSFFEYGHGIVDANAAVQALGGGSQPDPEAGETNTSVTTDRYYVSRGQNVTVSTQVTDENGRALANAEVDLTITRPNGTTLTNTVTTNSSGVASWTLSTSWSTATGTYSVQADTALSGYEGSSASTTFFVY
ncbi:S8 family serine peptidase [Alteribacter populi]|uniref:S8 family serine peptidase n=1 Tax=Alteribacter populi TaxID=2011011 RepID=UPI000BBB477C|nr:S8 family serine peptidase [Alteribacter populi]